MLTLLLKLDLLMLLWVGSLIINCRYTISNHPMKFLHPFTKELTTHEQAMATTGSSNEVEEEEEGEDGEMTAGIEMEIEYDSKII